MIVNRTLKVKLDLAPVDLVRVRETISELSQVYAKHVDYALTNKTIVKSKLHDGVYAKIIAEHPTLPTGLIQTIRDNAQGNLKAIHSRNPKKKWKVRPQKSEYSAINYDARTITLRGDQLSFSAIGKRVQTVINIPEWFKERYSGFVMKAATIRFDKKPKLYGLTLSFGEHSRISRFRVKLLALTEDFIPSSPRAMGRITERRRFGRFAAVISTLARSYSKKALGPLSDS